MFTLLLAPVVCLSGIITVSVPTPAHAMPFSCSGDIYQVQSGQLRIFDPLVSAYIDVGAANGSYNAVGFNTQDNFAYGSQGSSIIRIAADGTLTTVFSGNVNYNSFAGDVDSNNTLWLRRNPSLYAGVNLSNGAVTLVNVTGNTVGSADIIALEDGGIPYLIAISSNQVGRINLNTGVSTRVPLSGGLPNGSYGASWADSTGRVFAFNNDTGRIFEILNVFGPSPSGQLVAQGDPSSNNDGFSCDQAPFPNLPPLALDDDFTGPLNTNITGNVLVDNGNGIDEDPEGLGVVVNTTPVTSPANGTVTLLANGDFTYTPNTNFIGTDTFVYRITDPSGLTATATVTLDIAGTIAFTAVKTQSGGPDPVTIAGQVIDYEIELQNTGDIPLSGIVVDDTLPDGSSGTAILQGGDVNSDGILDLTETFTYTISYTVTQADMDASAPLVNQVSVTTIETGPTPQTSSATTLIDINPAIVVTKDASPRVNVPAGASVVYTYTVTNTGNVTISDINLTDVHLGTGSPPVPGNEFLLNDNTPTGDSVDTTINGNWDVLRPGDVVQFTANYIVTQQDVDNQ